MIMRTFYKSQMFPIDGFDAEFNTWMQGLSFNEIELVATIPMGLNIFVIISYQN